MSLVILIQFNSQVTEGVIDAMLNSDTVEVFEFVKETAPIIYGVLALYIAVFIYLLWQADKLKSAVKPKKRPWISLLLIILPIIDTVGKGASGRSYPLIIARTAYVYVVERAAMQKLLALRKDFRFNAKISGTPKKETYIFVIGETSRRDYYSLYGYYRDTTPKLDKQEGLLAFKDAISPANATVPSLKAILHLSTAEDDSQFYRTKSIVSLAKEAGYKTWWLSAQSRYGKYETSVTSSAIDSDVKQYIEGDKTLSRTFDSILLPLLDEGLADQAQQKFMVMHLYGSHISYKRRYPKEYSLFNGIPQGYEKHAKKTQQKINEYANSTAYTDYVLGEIIQKTDDKNETACVVYIADHGEYLAENRGDDFIGHGGANPHKVEVEVPLLIWCSKEYRDANPEKWTAMQKNQNSPINLDDTFYSLADIMHIDYGLMKLERSFFNEKFVPILPRKMRSSSTGRLFNYSELK